MLSYSIVCDTVTQENTDDRNTHLYFPVKTCDRSPLTHAHAARVQRIFLMQISHSLWVGPLDSYFLKRPFPITLIPLVYHKSDTGSSQWPLRAILQYRFLSDRSSLQEPPPPHPTPPHIACLKASRHLPSPHSPNSIPTQYLPCCCSGPELSQSSLLPSSVLESLQAQRMLYLLNQSANRHRTLKILRENIRGSTRMSSDRRISDLTAHKTGRHQVGPCQGWEPGVFLILSSAASGARRAPPP